MFSLKKIPMVKSTLLACNTSSNGSLLFIEHLQIDLHKYDSRWCLAVPWHFFYFTMWQILTFIPHIDCICPFQDPQNYNYDLLSYIQILILLTIYYYNPPWVRIHYRSTVYILWINNHKSHDFLICLHYGPTVGFSAYCTSYPLLWQYSPCCAF
jgi:hypothetical protein